MDREALVKNFQFLEIRNRTNSQKTVQYDDITGDGIPDTVTVNPGARRRIQTQGLAQIPSMIDFELVNPTIFQLRELGIIQLGDSDRSKNRTFGDGGETLAENAVRSGAAAGMNQRLPSGAADSSNAGEKYPAGSRPQGAIPPEEKGRRPVEAHPSDRGRR